MQNEKKSCKKNRHWKSNFRIYIVFHFNHTYGKVEEKPAVCVGGGLSLIFISCRVAFSFVFTLIVSSCSDLLFFPCKTKCSKTCFECGWEKKAGKLKGKRLFKCTVSLCLQSAFTPAIYGDSETSSHCLSVGSSHHASLSGEELKLLSREALQRSLEMQCWVWLDLIIQSVVVLLGEESKTRYRIILSCLKKWNDVKFSNIGKVDDRFVNDEEKTVYRCLKSLSFFLALNHTTLSNAGNLGIAAIYLVKVFSSCT